MVVVGVPVLGPGLKAAVKTAVKTAVKIALRTGLTRLKGDSSHGVNG